MHKISTSTLRPDSKTKSSGRAEYISDIELPDMLHMVILSAGIQHGKILKKTIPPLPVGYHIIGSGDFSGINKATIVAQDWPFFAEDEVVYYGQPVLAVVGSDKIECGNICSKIIIDYEELPAVSTIDEAVEFFNDYTIVKGKPDECFKSAGRILENTYRTGMQEQAYMEPQGMIAEFSGGRLTVRGSMQCPYYIKNSLNNAFDIGGDNIRVIQTETGGAFGGKEDYPSILAGQTAAAAIVTGKPVKLVMDRRSDMLITPKRHPSLIRIRTAVDQSGRISAMDIDCRLDAGAYESLSGVVLERAIFICTGAHNIENIRVRGRSMKTNHVPSGAFRGFGGPQALFAAEMNMYYAALELGVKPVDLKRRYQYRQGDRSVTGGTFRDDIKLDQMFDIIERASDYSRKYKEYERPSSPGERRRGIGISYAAHGGAFTGSGEQEIIKSLVRLKAEPAENEDFKHFIRILVSNVEMGQGASTTLRKIVAETMGLPLEAVIYTVPDTDVVPDSGPTVASRTIMIVGKLLQDAAEELKKNIDSGSPVLTAEKRYVHPEEFEWDEETFKGDAYPAYSWSINVVEVEVDPITFEVSITGSWGVYDVGTAIDLRILKGQMQGGTAQSLAYSTIERMEMSGGRPAQASFTDYTIPTTLDFPDTECFFIDNPYRYGPFGAKAAGELPNEGPAGAVAAAVSQAVGRIITEIPVTPEMLEAASR
ncbi:MAG: xanthine dehydrogenase family protein [Spirochaetales bacterium]|nr:xanthine dehydrogenase family protein [Spirochaetales bacterium]